MTQALLQNPSLASGTWADLGTGSGALAIATARQLGSAGRVGVWRLHLVSHPLAALGSGTADYPGITGFGSGYQRGSCSMGTPERGSARCVVSCGGAIPLFHAITVGDVGTDLSSTEQCPCLWFQVMVGDWFEALRGLPCKLSGVLSNPPHSHQ